MALRTAYRETSAGIRIPYPAQSGTNHGFVDLRGRPDLAATIAEAAGSTALHKLLVRLAVPGSPIWTLGCDLGVHDEKAAPAPRRQVAGGYLHVVRADYQAASAQDCHVLARSLESGLADKVGRRNWELAFLLQDVELHLDGGDPRPCSSLSICFYASAPNPAAAVHSREALIGALDAALAASAASQALGSSKLGL